MRAMFQLMIQKLLVLGCLQIPTTIDALSQFRRSVVMDCSNLTSDQNPEISFETEEYHFCHIIDFLLDFCMLYYVPAIILLGLIGNLLSCLVFLKTSLHSSSYYLAALATSDFTYLFVLIFVWLNNTIGWKVFNSDGWCETVVYIGSVCGTLSTWLIVAFTIERFKAIQYPLHSQQMCTIERAKKYILGLTITALIFHLYILFVAGVIKNRSREECALKMEYIGAMQIINIIDMIVSLIVPLILIIVMNTMIMRNLLKSNTRFNVGESRNAIRLATMNSDLSLNLPVISGYGDFEMVVFENTRRSPPYYESLRSFHSSCQESSFHSSHFPRSLPPRPPKPFNLWCHCPHQPTCTLSVISSSVQYPGMNRIQTEATNDRSSYRNVRPIENITKMLVLISTVFVLLNLPSYVIRLCVFFFTLAKKNTPVTIWCLQQFFMLLYYTNFSINFLLYTMCGGKFRQCLRSILYTIFQIENLPDPRHTYD